MSRSKLWARKLLCVAQMFLKLQSQRVAILRVHTNQALILLAPQLKPNFQVAILYWYCQHVYLQSVFNSSIHESYGFNGLKEMSL